MPRFIRSFIPGFTDLCILLGVVSATLLQMDRFADDPGVGWHLASGSWMREHHAVPNVDPFLYSHQPRAWVSDQWLSDVVLSVIRDLGWPVLYALLTVLYVLTYWKVLYPAVRRHAGSWMGAAVSVLFAFKMGQVHFILRPVLFAFFFFALLLRWIYGYQERRGAGVAKLIGRLSWIGLPCMFCLWANMHPTFVIGLFTLGLLPLGIALEAMLFGTSREAAFQDAAKLLMLLAACTLVTLINPAGIHLHQSIVALSHSDYFMQLHEEWHGIAIRDVEGQLFEFSLLMILFCAFLSRKRAPTSGFTLLSVICFSHFTLTAVRILPFFSMVIAFPLAASFAPLASAFAFEQYASFRVLAQVMRRQEQRERRTGAGRLALVALCLAILADAVFHGQVLWYRGPFGFSRDKYPYESVAYIGREASAVMQRRVVVANPEWGGFITWFGNQYEHGQPRVFPVIDDRNTLLGERFYKHFLAQLRPSRDWRGLLHELGATHLLLRSDSDLARMIKENGALPLVHEDAVSLLFSVK